MGTHDLLSANGDDVMVRECPECGSADTDGRSLSIADDADHIWCNDCSHFGCFGYDEQIDW